MNQFIEAALIEACLSEKENGIPIGAVLVDAVSLEIIGRGHNRRVQNGDPMAHAEIECLRDAGRIEDYSNTILYSTLMPCYLCSGAIVQFGIPKVFVGEDDTFGGDPEFLRDRDVEVINLNLRECKHILESFILVNPNTWNEDIGACSKS